MDTKIPVIFLSYSWKNKEHAERMCRDLTLVGLDVIMDSHVLKYTERLTDFMKRIRSCDYALLLVSDSYLKSINCMYETLQMQKDEGCWNKVLPVVTSDLNLSDLARRLEYIKYWEEKSRSIQSAIANIDPANALGILQELRNCREVAASIDGFMANISGMLYLSPEALYAENYASLVKHIGHEPNHAALIQLLTIALKEDLAERELDLDRYQKEFGESSFYYSIRAGTARAQGNIPRAKYLYEQAILLEPDDYSALNNLGQIKEHFDHDYEGARDCYAKAISARPDLDVPRLNLGVLLNARFDDREGGRQQFESIIAFDPNNAKAHNNLANYYKIKNLNVPSEKFEYHIRKALEINPQYVDALLNYGNYLKTSKNEKEAGNEQYRLALKYDTSGSYKELIKALLKIDKG